MATTFSERRSPERLEFDQHKRGNDHGPLCRWCPHPKHCHPDEESMLAHLRAMGDTFVNIQPGECVMCVDGHVFEARGVESRRAR
jgi:hypothetical protein